MIKLTTSESEDTVKIEFWENHCGHKQEIGRIGIDEDTRIKIAGIYNTIKSLSIHFTLNIIIY